MTFIEIFMNGRKTEGTKAANAVQQDNAIQGRGRDACVALRKGKRLELKTKCNGCTSTESPSESPVILKGI